jgi:hypothetical protein
MAALVCGALLFSIATLVQSSTQLAALSQSGDTPFIILDDATATLSNSADIHKDTPLEKASASNVIGGSYSMLKPGQSLLWKDPPKLPAGMYEIFLSAPTAEKQPVYAKISSYVVSKAGKSTGISSYPSIGANAGRSESFENRSWTFAGSVYIEDRAILYSVIFSALGTGTERTPVDGVLLKWKADQNAATTLTFDGGYVDERDKLAQTDLRDGGRPLTAGTYVVTGTWGAIADLTSAQKIDPKSTARTPYEKFEIYGSVTGKTERAFELIASLDLRTASAGPTVSGKQWQELGKVTIPADVTTLKLKWTVAEVPGSQVKPGKPTWFPVTVRNTSASVSSESSSSAASTTTSASSASTTSASSAASTTTSASTTSASSASTTSASSASTTSAASSASATTTSASSSSAPTLNVNSSSSVASVPGATGVLDLTPGSAVLDNGSAGFFSVGFKGLTGAGYRNGYHTAAAADALATPAGGASAGWRMPTLEHGQYDAYLTWPTVSGGSPATTIVISTIVPSGGTYLKISKTVIVNQSRAPSGPSVAGMPWQQIARVTIDALAGHNTIELKVNPKTAQGTAFADALLLRKVK